MLSRVRVLMLHLVYVLSTQTSRWDPTTEEEPQTSLSRFLFHFYSDVCSWEKNDTSLVLIKSNPQVTKRELYILTPVTWNRFFSCCSSSHETHTSCIWLLLKLFSRIIPRCFDQKWSLLFLHQHELRGSEKPARSRLKRLSNLQMDGLCWSYDFCHLQAVHAKNFNYNDKYKADAVSIAADS